MSFVMSKSKAARGFAVSNIELHSHKDAVPMSSDMNLFMNPWEKPSCMNRTVLSLSEVHKFPESRGKQIRHPLLLMSIVTHLQMRHVLALMF